MEPAAQGGDATPRWWLAVASLPLVAGAFAQRFGEVVSQTRLDRVLDPLAAMARTLNLWDPTTDMGTVPNQAVGYLVSFDVPFAIGRLVGAPVWVVDRLVVAAVLVAALWGFVRLVDALGVGRPLTRLAGGIAFALAPVVLSRVGWRLPEAVAPALLPLLLLPLVRGARGGSTRVAAARSGVVVAVIGGANAIVTLSVLAVPLLYLLTRQRGPRRASLVRWWLLSVVLAVALWAPSLWFLRRFGADLVTYTEPVATTTAPATLFNVLRGSADWLVALDGGQFIPAASTLALRVVPIIAVGIVVGFGLGGLASRHLPERRFLVATLVAGVLVLVGATSGWFGNPLAEPYRWALTGPLFVFRNVYKFSGLVALPVCIGFTHALAIGAEWLGRRLHARSMRLAASGLVAVVLVGAAWPVVTGTLTRPPGFAEEPPAWIEAKAWLDARADGRVLVVPGQTEALYDWGRTSQLPLQWDSDVRWATRSQIPLSGAPAGQYLDAVELAIERGGTPGLLDFLRRGGFSQVVVPNDSVPDGAGLPDPERVAQALASSGLEQVAAFGESGFGFGDRRQLEVWDVPGSALVSMYPVASASWLSGDVESVLSVPESAFGDRAWVLVRDGVPAGVTLDNWLVTDGNQRVALEFGLNRNNRSPVLGPFEDDVDGRPVQGRRWVDDDVTHQTTLDLDGVRTLTASSIGPGPLVRASPAVQPANVFDGDVDTVWLPARLLTAGVDQWGDEDPWIDVTFDEPRQVEPLGITLRFGVFRDREPVRVTVTTDSGWRTTELAPVTDRQELAIAPGPTTGLRIALDRSSLDAGGDWVGIAEVDLPGAPPIRRLRTPAELEGQFAAPSANDPAWVLTRNRASSLATVGLNAEPAIARRFTVPKAMEVGIEASASVARRNELVTALGSAGSLTVTANATLADRGRLAPRNLVDADPTTIWRSGGRTGEERAAFARVTLGWQGERVIDRFILDVPGDLATPATALVSMGDDVRLAPVEADGSVRFAPLRGNRLVIGLLYPPTPDGTPPADIGLAGIDVPALADLTLPPIDPTDVVTISCDAGPTVRVGGTEVRFSATVPLGALLDSDTFAMQPCDTTTVALPAGDIELDATDGTNGVALDQVVLGSPPLLSTDTGVSRPVTVDGWASNDRRVTVGPGEAGLLVVPETFNEGWEASLDGVALAALEIDGWRQGFVVPAGAGGAIDLRFAPNGPFRWSVALGLGLLVVLALAAVLPSRRPHPGRPLEAGTWSQPLAAGGAVVASVWASGVLAVLLVPLWWIGRRRPAMLGGVAAGSFIAAAVTVVVFKRSLAPWVPWWEVAPIPVTILSAVALVSVVVAALVDRQGSGDD